MQAPGTASVAGLFVHPLKGCRAVEVDRATVLTTGLETDRGWMAIDGVGRFLSQREVPALGQVRARADETGLHLSLPGLPSLSVPWAAAREPVTVTIWRDTVRALDAGDEAAHWLQEALGREARLVRFDHGARRGCNPEYAGDSGAHTHFADGYPVLVIGESSLDELNARLPRPVVMRRFRPNVVIRGLAPHEEDHLDRITIGAVELGLVKPCTRCEVTTIDPITGKRDPDHEPLATLARYRMDARLGGVTFGVNAIVRAGAGASIAVGDTVSVRHRF